MRAHNLKTKKTSLESSEHNSTESRIDEVREHLQAAAALLSISGPQYSGMSWLVEDLISHLDEVPFESGELRAAEGQKQSSFSVEQVEALIAAYEEADRTDSKNLKSRG
jgi:hypothetical protein